MSFVLDCPKCGKEMPINAEALPDRACDEEDFQCPHCGQEMEIGWYATAEIRNIKEPT